MAPLLLYDADTGQGVFGRYMEIYGDTRRYTEIYGDIVAPLLLYDADTGQR